MDFEWTARPLHRHAFGIKVHSSIPVQEVAETIIDCKAGWQVSKHGQPAKHRLDAPAFTPPLGFPNEDDVSYCAWICGPICDNARLGDAARGFIPRPNQIAKGEQRGKEEDSDARG